LSVSDWGRLAARIGEYAGLDPPAWLLEARGRERAGERGLDEAAYLALAAGDDDAGARERAVLAERLRVGETRFFRHAAQMAALRGGALVERVRVAAAERRPLRAWSAGCASGEEAWTLAMLLDEVAERWELLATDLSAAAVSRAAAGRYAAAQLADVPPELRARWFENLDGDVRVRDERRGGVRFEVHNLVELRSFHRRALDLILCRNVLIYFEPQRRAEVVTRLHDALAPGGLLLFGYAESVRDDERFEALRGPEGAVLLRRRARPSAARPHGVPSPSLPGPPHAPASPVPPSMSAHPIVPLRGEFADEGRLAAALRPLVAAAPRRMVLDLDGVEYFSDGAARVLARALSAAPAIELRATRPALRRWLARHGLVRT
jgi:chemotaxis protein methyltransferase CheR